VSPTQSPTPNARYDLTVLVFDSSGHLVATILSAQVSGPPSALHLSSDPFVATGSNVLTISSAAGDFSAIWNGTDSDSNRAESGAYIVEAKYTQIGKPDAVSVQTARFSLIWSADQTLSSAILAPNPASGDFVRLFWAPKPGFTIRAKIYNVAGELILIQIEDAGVGFKDWRMNTASNQSAAPGVYIWALELIDSRGQVVDRGFKKLVVMH
jgi:hypothetical protein